MDQFRYSSQIIGFIFIVYILICTGKSLHRVKRANTEPSFYDRLKQTLDPVLHRANMSNVKSNNVIKNKRESAVKTKLSSSHASIKSMPKRKLGKYGKKNFKQKRSFDTDQGCEITSILVPKDIETDYDYTDQDLPDVEEPPAHIFEYNRANNTKEKELYTNFEPQRHPVLPDYTKFTNYFSLAARPTDTQSVYEKCKASLDPLVQNLNLSLAKANSQHKKFNPAELQIIQKNLKTRRNNVLGNQCAQSEYNSLYDEFKKRLEHFSNELGVDAGLANERDPLDVITSSNTKVVVDKPFNDFIAVKHNIKDMPLELKKSEDFKNDPKKFHENNGGLKEAHKRSSLLVSSPLKSKPAKKNVGGDFDFWVDQRGFTNLNQKLSKPIKQHNYERYYNSQKYPKDSNSPCDFVDNNLDYGEDSKTKSVFKQQRVHMMDNRRAFRDVGVTLPNYLGPNGFGNDGTSKNTIFPGVFTEPVHSQLSPPLNFSARSLLENIAGRLNTSTLDVAKKVAGIQDLNLSTLTQDPELHKILQQYIENSVISAAQSAQVVGQSKSDPNLGKQSVLANQVNQPVIQNTPSAFSSPQQYETKIENTNTHFFEPIKQQQNSLQSTVQYIPTTKPLTTATTTTTKKVPTPTTECIPITTTECTEYEPSMNFSMKTTTTSPDDCTDGPTTSDSEECEYDDDTEEVQQQRTRPMTSSDNGCPWEQTTMTPDPKTFSMSSKGSKNGLSDRQVTQILDKLMQKLEEIQFEKFEIDEDNSFPAEDAPCKLSGSWLSGLGLRFDIEVENETQTALATQYPEAKRLKLNIGVQEWLPPKPHFIIDTDWPFTGSALKELGGPFYFYTQKRSENVLATFVGYCRNCGGTDTIFGTWSFSFPSKNCQDTSASFQIKNDVMRRYKLDEKRRERYKELLLRNSNFCKQKKYAN